MRQRRITMGTLLPLLVVVLLVLIAAAPLVDADDASPPSRSMFVVCDSIALGASDELHASMPQDWDVRVDAEVSRPTNVGLDVVRANRASIDDVLVIGLGANDSGSPSVFAARVEAMLAEVADVPHVFWIELAEVRSYYPRANAIIRELASRYDNVSIIPWHDIAAANANLTAADGLHLTRAGAQRHADAIVEAAMGTDLLRTGLLLDLREASEEARRTPRLVEELVARIHRDVMRRAG